MAVHVPTGTVSMSEKKFKRVGWVIKGADLELVEKDRDQANKVISKYGFNEAKAEIETLRAEAQQNVEKIIELSKQLGKDKGELTRSRADLAKCRAMLKDTKEVLIATHPHGSELKRQLDSGELERRLKTLGKKFDPHGKIKLLLEIAELVKEGE